MMLIRHGQSEFNAAFNKTRIDPGIKDPSLTEEGVRQIEAAVAALAEQRFDRILASPFTRTLQTADIIAKALNLPVSVDPIIRERSYFQCDIGSPRSLLLDQWAEFDFTDFEERWWDDPEESEAAMQVRCRAFRGRMAKVEDWHAVLVVSHYAFIEGLTGEQVKNAAIVRHDPTLDSPGDAHTSAAD